jgi:hypothetical protein
MKLLDELESSEPLQAGGTHMKVRVDELRQLTEILFTHLEAEGRQEFDIDDDYYWVIPSEQRYNPLEAPKELTLGQLTDEWEWLSQVRQGQSEPIAYHLVWLSSVLCRVGEKIVK